MSTGPATERGGDWFGSTVNLAARVAGEASGGEVLLTEATKSAAAPREQFSFHERGRVELRNVSEPVLIFAALRRGIVSTQELPTDPVCQMVVDPESAAGSLRYKGVVYSFCSLSCAARFAAEADRFAASVGE